MPIYAYRCSSCGCQQDVMQKMSDAALSACPGCGKQTFTKQVTAAGFQFRGSGYYVTDFKNGQARPAVAEAACAPCASAGSCPAAGAMPDA